MQLLMSETDTCHLLLIAAYRDNEVPGAHPLMLMLDEIRKIDATVHQITLAPLDRLALNCLIADTLLCSPERAMPLTELVLAKTQGNPFFSTQFLKSLYEDGLISFAPPQSLKNKGFSLDFSSFLQSSLRKESTLSLKEERKLKRTLIRQLEAEEIENAYTFADTLVDMGVYENIDQFLSLLKRSDSQQYYRNRVQYFWTTTRD